jgi:hypothetical protein
MTLTIDIASDTQARLVAEASRRGISVDQVIAELASKLPLHDPLEAFIGSGASGLGDLGRNHREQRAEATKGLTARGL